MLDHVIVLNQRYLERLLKKFIEDYYHTARPHQDLREIHRSHMIKLPKPLVQASWFSIPILGGLHHRYRRVAA